MHSVIFSQISSRLKNFPSNQSPIFLISFLQKEGFCIVRYGFIKSHENVKCNVEFVLVVRVEILIKITQCHCLDPTFLQNRTTDFDETLHAAWVRVWLPEGFGNSGRSGYSPVQKKGGRRSP